MNVSTDQAEHRWWVRWREHVREYQGTIGLTTMYLMTTRVIAMKTTYLWCKSTTNMNRWHVECVFKSMRRNNVGRCADIQVRLSTHGQPGRRRWNRWRRTWRRCILLVYDVELPLTPIDDRWHAYMSASDQTRSLGTVIRKYALEYRRTIGPTTLKMMMTHIMTMHTTNLWYNITVDVDRWWVVRVFKCMGPNTVDRYGDMSARERT